jgi:transcriptional regulator with XRE-family HTH domain
MIMSLYKLKKISAEEYLNKYLEVEYCEGDLVFGLEHYMNNFDFAGNLLTGEQISEYNMNMSASYSCYPLNEVDYLSEEWDENALTYVIVDDLIWEIPNECSYKALELARTTKSLYELRKEKGATLMEVSSATGLCPSTISKSENGLISITSNIAKKFSEYYGVDIKPKKLVATFKEYEKEPSKRDKIITNLKNENSSLKKVVAEYERQINDIKNILGISSVE